MVALTERRHIPAQDNNRLRVPLDKEGFGGPSRQCLEPESAGAGKGVEHRFAGKRDAVGGELPVRKDIEQCLSSAVAGRPNRVSGRG